MVACDVVPREVVIGECAVDGRVVAPKAAEDVVSVIVSAELIVVLCFVASPVVKFASVVVATGVHGSCGSQYPVSGYIDTGPQKSGGGAPLHRSCVAAESSIVASTSQAICPPANSFSAASHTSSW